MHDIKVGAARPAWAALMFRSVVGGGLMGLANLVPGISGGTMLLAAGIYPAFIQSVAAVTTLRLRVREGIVLGGVTVAAGLTILFLAGTVKDLVVHHRWVMYSLFIGLTLGGVPVVRSLIERMDRAVWGGICGGFAGMLLLVWLQAAGIGTAGADGTNMPLLFMAGLAGASAMILPGLSGGYLLLLLGQYIPILAAIAALRQALAERAVGEIMAVGFRVILPVGLGVVVGVCTVSHILRFLLSRFRSATLGVLLGLLLGAVAGLWPFQQGVPPEPGDMFKGRVLTADMIDAIDPDAYPTVRFRPGRGQVAGALGLMAAGFLVTAALAQRPKAGVGYG